MPNLGLDLPLARPPVADEDATVITPRPSGLAPQRPPAPPLQMPPPPPAAPVTPQPQTAMGATARPNTTQYAPRALGGQGGSSGSAAPAPARLAQEAEQPKSEHFESPRETIESFLSVYEYERTGSTAQLERAAASLTLARRLNVPDLSLGVTYQMQGIGSLAIRSVCWLMTNRMLSLRMSKCRLERYVTAPPSRDSVMNTKSHLPMNTPSYPICCRQSSHCARPC